MFFSPLVCDAFSSLRIDDEASSLKEKIEKMKAIKPDEDCTKSPKEATILAIEVSLILYNIVQRGRATAHPQTSTWTDR